MSIPTCSGYEVVTWNIMTINGPSDAQQRIHDLIADGYVPHGNLCFDTPGNVQFAQAFVKWGAEG